MRDRRAPSDGEALNENPRGERLLENSGRELPDDETPVIGLAVVQEIRDQEGVCGVRTSISFCSESNLRFVRKALDTVKHLLATA